MNSKGTTKKQKTANSFGSRFSSYYNKAILPLLDPIEKERKKYMTIITAIIIIAVIICIIVGFIFPKDIITLCIGCAIAVSSACVLIDKIFNEKAKKDILPKILSFIGKFETNTDSNTLSTYVKDLHLFDDFRFYIYDDRLKGKYKDLDIIIEEISLERGKPRHKKGNIIGNNNQNERREPIAIPAKTRMIHHLITNITQMIMEQKAIIDIPEKLFSGLFIRVPCHKKYKGRTIVKAERSSHKIKDENKVNLEDPIFEKLYDTFSTDQIEARYLLTTAFMNRMVMLNQKGIGNRIYISFENGFVNIAVSSKKDWFKLHVNKPVTDIKLYKNIVSELYSVLKIIDDLKLEQNIGI